MIPPVPRQREGSLTSNFSPRSPAERDGRPGGPSLPQRPAACGRARPPGSPQLRTRKTLPHDIPLWLHPEDEVWFVTICTLPRGKDQLCHSHVSDALFETIEFRNKRGDWLAHLALLMPDHVHLLVSLPGEIEMARVIAQWKEITAKRLWIKWQRDFFDHRLRRDESFREKEDYIRLNPVRAGLVGRPADWPYVWTPVIGARGGRALPDHGKTPTRFTTFASDVRGAR